MDTLETSVRLQPFVMRQESSSRSHFEFRLFLAMMDHMASVLKVRCILEVAEWVCINSVDLFGCFFAATKALYWISSSGASKRNNTQ